MRGCSWRVSRFLMAGANAEEVGNPLAARAKTLWSFQPVQMPTVPHSRFDALARNPVDRFVFAALEKKGLQPCPPASRLVLLRRVTVDLTGLPPTPAEVQAFLADKSPNAYEKVVDRLLASPAYGERWGRHWLDVVRYGESHGYEQNHLRPNAWPYRDYVIRAFNSDKPYNEFVTEQLAGDIVGKGDPEREAATGFLVAGIHDTVGNSTEEGTRQQRSNDLDDMVSTTAATFLGLTVNCAKCHDHKFDPIAQKDYYRMAAVFADVRHGERALSLRPLTPAQQTRLTQLRADMESCNARQQALENTTRARLTGNSATRRPPVNAQRNIEDFAPISARFVRFTILTTNTGNQPCLDEIQIFAPNSAVNLAAASGGAKATASSVLPGYAIHQIAHLNDGQTGNDHSWISNEPNGGWAQIELPNAARIGRIVWSRDAEARLQDRLATGYRVEVSADGKTWQQVASSEDRLPFTSISRETLLSAMTTEQRAQWQKLQSSLEKLQRQEATLTPPANAYIGQFGNPDPVYLLTRGDVMQRGEQVAPGALSLLTALPQMPTLPQTALSPTRTAAFSAPSPATANSLTPRLALARWICDPRNPLTARVLVNRVWAHHFGQGLTDTPSDFGNIGARPSHPELLDWLASHFVEGSGVRGQGSGKDAQVSGFRVQGSEKNSRAASPDTWNLKPETYACNWRLKPLHRLLVTSYTYQQASDVTREGADKDGDNRLLWRMPLRRMEAEAVRDAVLASSGNLDRTMGGPGFALFQYNVVNVAIYEARGEQGPETWRRSVYQIPARGIRDDLLGNFDCPDSSERAAKRTSTTTALQTLTLLNSRFLTQQANDFAVRITHAAGNAPEAQARTAFQIAFGRVPNTAEQTAAASLIRQHGLTTLCRALFNANEFLYY